MVAYPFLTITASSLRPIQITKLLHSFVMLFQAFIAAPFSCYLFWLSSRGEIQLGEGLVIDLASQKPFTFSPKLSPLFCWQCVLAHCLAA